MAIGASFTILMEPHRAALAMCAGGSAFGTDMADMSENISPPIVTPVGASPNGSRRLPYLVTHTGQGTCMLNLQVVR